MTAKEILQSENIHIIESNGKWNDIYGYEKSQLKNDLLDYITTLQEENEKLESILKLREDVIITQHNKIDKAINYIKNFELYYDDELGLVNMMGAGNTRTPVVLSRDLLNILQGDGINNE